ncbi:MAG: condensation domain-containing protein [Polyangiaceae bacterium]
MRLSRELTQQLLQLAPAAFSTTIDDLLLSALSRAVCRWTGRPDTLITLEGHGRESETCVPAAELDLSRTLGWFTSMYPVRLTRGDASLDEVILATRAQLRAVPNKGIGYGVLRYLSSDPDVQRALSRSAPRITFNYLGQFDQVLKAESAFGSAPEDRGLEHAPEGPLSNWLEILGDVSEGRLSMTWVFSRLAYRADTIERLKSFYEEELSAIIHHCVARARRAQAAPVPPAVGL